MLKKRHTMDTKGRFAKFDEDSLNVYAKGNQLNDYKKKKDFFHDTYDYEISRTTE